MDKAETLWPEERSWSVQLLAGYLRIPSQELIHYFQKITPFIKNERDQVQLEDLRLLKAHCERLYEEESTNSVEKVRKKQLQGRKMIKNLIPQINQLTALKDYTKALNTYIYMLGETCDISTPEEKAHWYEEMGRLCLKANRHPNEASKYFKKAIFALSLLDDREGIRDLLEAYEENFSGEEGQNSWKTVRKTADEWIKRLHS
jgi:hypothetical protein